MRERHELARPLPAWGRRATHTNWGLMGGGQAWRGKRLHTQVSAHLGSGLEVPGHCPLLAVRVLQGRGRGGGRATRRKTGLHEGHACLWLRELTPPGTTIAHSAPLGPIRLAAWLAGRGRASPPHRVHRPGRGVGEHLEALRDNDDGVEYRLHADGF